VACESDGGEDGGVDDDDVASSADGFLLLPLMADLRLEEGVLGCDGVPMESSDIIVVEEELGEVFEEAVVATDGVVGIESASTSVSCSWSCSCCSSSSMTISTNSSPRAGVAHRS